MTFSWFNKHQIIQKARVKAYYCSTCTLYWSLRQLLACACTLVSLGRVRIHCWCFLVGELLEAALVSRKVHRHIVPKYTIIFSTYNEKYFLLICTDSLLPFSPNLVHNSGRTKDMIIGSAYAGSIVFLRFLTEAFGAREA